MSAEMGPLVPEHHPGDAGPRVSVRDQTSGDGPGMFLGKGGHADLDERLIPITVPRCAGCSPAWVWKVNHPAELVLSWSSWRRHHQTQARRCHYQRRLSLLASQVQTVVLEPVYNLFRISTAKARTTICRLVLSFLSQFFQRRRHFSSQPKDRSPPIVSAAPRKCAVRCVSPLPPRLPAGSAPPWQRVSRCIPHPPAHSAPGSGWPGGRSNIAKAPARSVTLAAVT